MTQFAARMFLLLAVASLLAHYLPAFYDLVSAQRFRGPGFNYSQVERAIIATRPVADGFLYVNVATGQTYSREEFQAILPLNNHALLMRQERMPASLDGVVLSRHAILSNRVDLRVSPRDFQDQVVRLRPLLEAEDFELNLGMPPDFVRPGARFTFLNAEANAIDIHLTDTFSLELEQQGFVFPVVHFANNPTSRKTFDDGMLLVDAEGQWYRIRREHDEPVVQKLAIDLDPIWLQVREQLNREIRAVVVDRDHSVWLLVGEGFKAIPIPLRRFDPQVTRLSLRGNLLDLQFSAVHGDSVEYLVLNRDFAEIAWHGEDLPPWYERPGQALRRALFPVSLSFKVPYQNFIGAYFAFGHPWAWLPGLFLAFLLFVLRSRFRWAAPFDAPALGVILVFGWIGVIAALCVPRLKD